ncbi:AAA family ATPase [Deinococcus sp. QL22]|uniref:AAA family ATPase n=1 Tax=Deinococcus sp. QL22 TaxID=2939437 RepID=UPI002017688F|nr:AAA family ATPase [Deinococcus sp. QL22]UQN05318.1 DNA topology modulation protein FlaR [Deinococcus sp. QL22]
MTAKQLPIQRVLIVGSPGAGKSTLAKKLATRTGLPLIHLDELYWNPGWIKVEPAVWQQRLAEALAAERWILDGNFSTTLRERALRADLVVFLMPPRLLCLWRAFWRERLNLRPHARQDGAKWPSRALLLDIWQFPPQAQQQRQELTQLPNLKVVVLRSDAEIGAWLAQQSIATDHNT